MFSINEYFRLMWVSIHDMFRAKTTFECHDWHRRHSIFLILRTREGHIYHDNLWLSPAEGHVHGFLRFHA